MKKTTTIKNKLLTAAVALAAMATPLAAMCQTASVTEEELVTYPFSDANPIPSFGSIYPYFKYEGFATKSQKQKWTVITLENQYLRLKILPQIGGKIWSVVDKRTSEEMFYDNDAVKFRDIALRGPWTSGGIEFNFGVIGHAPTCSAPVDYKIVNKDDGSVSCYLGVLDLLTRSRWGIEVNLPKDRGWFTTRTVWHNSSGEYKPYYTWTNTGVTATDDLHFIYPATHWIGHDGLTGSWPFDSVHGRDLSEWKQMNFGADQSYHMAGNHGPYFATYYANKNFGMMHLANRDDKLGRKFFTWALSDQGDIWRELLTDHKTQYVELQSGRLFNQNKINSSLTPYKQFLFTPFGTDEWTEYWFPYSGTGGVAGASELGVVNVSAASTDTKVSIYALTDLAGTLSVVDSLGHDLARHEVNVKTANSVTETFGVELNNIQKIKLGGKTLWSRESQDLSRPQATPKNFDWNTAYAQYLLARDSYGMGEMKSAQKAVDKALQLDANYGPALGLKAALCNYSFNYAEALDYAHRALAIDQYDADANYQAGIAAINLSKKYDALDGFEMAAITSPLRSAAYTQLAKLYFSTFGDLGKAEQYALRSTDYNAANVTAYQLLCRIYASRGNAADAARMLDKIEKLDPLNHFVDFERYCNGSMTKEAFLGNIKEEFPAQELLELASFYIGIGDDAQAQKVLDTDPTGNTLIKIWRAKLSGDASALAQISSKDLDFAFPFRNEDKQMLDWAAANSEKWEYRYLLALLHKARGNDDKARELLNEVASAGDVQYAPFYALMASSETDDMAKEHDLATALSLDKDQWRYCQQLTHFYLNRGDNAKALAVVKPYYKKHSDKFQIATLYVRTLIANKDYATADHILATTTILPFEGETGGHALYHKVKIARALQAIESGKLREASQFVAQARLWPHNLGSGKPFDENIDSRLEDWLDAVIAAKSGNTAEAGSLFTKVAEAKKRGGYAQLLQAVALSKTGKNDEAQALVDHWVKLQSNTKVASWGQKLYNEFKNAAIPFNNTLMRQFIK